MGVIDTKTLPTFALTLGQQPCQPLAVPVLIIFGSPGDPTPTSQRLDLSNWRRLSTAAAGSDGASDSTFSVQSVYIDMSGSDVSMSLIVDGALQNITAKGRTQGYYAILGGPQYKDAAFKCTAISAVGIQTIIPIVLLNVPRETIVWPTQ